MICTITRLYNDEKRYTKSKVFRADVRLDHTILRGSANYHQLERTFGGGAIALTFNQNDVELDPQNLTIVLDEVPISNRSILGPGVHTVLIGNLKYQLVVRNNSEE